MKILRTQRRGYALMLVLMFIVLYLAMLGSRIAGSPRRCAWRRRTPRASTVTREAFRPSRTPSAYWKAAPRSQGPRAAGEAMERRARRAVGPGPQGRRVKVSQAKAEIDTEAEAARQTILGTAGDLAGQVVRAVLPASAGGSR